MTRVEPEIFVPPRPGQEVRRATGLRRDQALFFDGMERKVPIGLSRDGEPVYANLDFLDGSRGAHVNISGISGVATKTSYATFLLHSLFTSGALGGEAANTHAIVFNVKGEDLLFLDQANARLKDEDRQAYAKMGLPAEPFGSVQILAPVRKGSAERLPATGSRGEGVQAFFWTIREVVEERLLRFLFAEADDTASQLSFVVDRIEAKLAAAAAAKGGAKDAWIEIEGRKVETFDDLVETLDRARGRRGRAWPSGGRGRRGAGHGRGFRETPSRGRAPRRDTSSAGRDVGQRDAHLLDWKAKQLSVVDIHALHDRAKRFVVGAVLKRMFEEKESLGTARPLVFVVLDELNKYAPREGSGPIKEVLLDISERGRSLGIVLIGAQQTASRGREPDRGQRVSPGRRPSRRGRGRAAGVRLPDRRRPRPGRHPQARHHDRPAARDPDRAPGAVPVPGLGHPQERGGGAGRGGPVRGLPRALGSRLGGERARQAPDQRRNDREAGARSPGRRPAPRARPPSSRPSPPAR